MAKANPIRIKTQSRGKLHQQLGGPQAETIPAGKLAETLAHRSLTRCRLPRSQRITPPTAHTRICMVFLIDSAVILVNNLGCMVNKSGLYGPAA
jgi:hypothetical protein